MMTMILGKLGWVLSDRTRTIAYNGVECLSHIHSILEESEPALHLPQVFLMDLSMDVMDGLECTRRIRAEIDPCYRQVGLSPPYVIACTANALHESRTACQDAKFDDFLTKPLGQEQLIAALKQAAEHVLPAQRALLARDVSNV
jgi:CheY-like chemotaxis protein